MSGFRHCGRRDLREYFVVILQVFSGCRNTHDNNTENVNGIADEFKHGV